MYDCKYDGNEYIWVTLLSSLGNIVDTNLIGIKV